MSSALVLSSLDFMPRGRPPCQHPRIRRGIRALCERECCGVEGCHFFFASQNNGFLPLFIEINLPGKPAGVFMIHVKGMPLIGRGETIVKPRCVWFTRVVADLVHNKLSAACGAEFGNAFVSQRKHGIPDTCIACKDEYAQDAKEHGEYTTTTTTGDYKSDGQHDRDGQK